jgi:molybdopterin-binding protein
VGGAATGRGYRSKTRRFLYVDIGRSASMEISARNKFSGTVTEIIEGPVTTEVKIDTGGCGHVIVSTITTEASKELDLKVGDKAWALFKASSVIVATD